MNDSVRPKSVSRAGNYKITRFNALRHGVLSQHTVLPWENREEYEALLEALVAEYKPEGPTEEHLVEEVAGIIWRKRRLRVGEKAAHSRALQRATDPDQYPTTSKAALVLITDEFEGRVASDAISATEEKTAAAGKNLEDEEARALEALKILASKGRDPYGRAIAVLSEAELINWRRRLRFDPGGASTRRAASFGECRLPKGVS
jgi:hypothetical protein